MLPRLATLMDDAMRPAQVPYMRDMNETPQERAEWEANRRKECFLDLWAYGRRVVFASLIGAVILALIAWLASGSFDLLPFLTAVLAAAIVGGALTIWLRDVGKLRRKATMSDRAATQRCCRRTTHKALIPFRRHAVRYLPCTFC